VIIEHCAHPDYRGFLRDYVAMGGHGHSRLTLKAAFGMHLAFAQTGDMRHVNWGEFK
jgi:propionyl-CoA:succinyl-CoA transferase